MIKRKRITTEDIKNNRFYQMPKFLFEDEFKELSNDARVLYSLLRDRHDLSISNGWVNKNNEVYLIYTRENMASMLGCSQPTIRKAVNQLIDYRLIEEQRQGLNKPNLIYLADVSIENTRTEKSFQSRVKDSFSQECKILSPNDTEVNDTDFKETEKTYIHLSPKDEYVKNYLNYYNMTFNKSHPRVTPEQLGEINHAVNILEEVELDMNDYIDAVWNHFSNLPPNNNGNILAFIKTFKRYFDIDLRYM